jgi:hypothetical protein
MKKNDELLLEVGAPAVHGGRVRVGAALTGPGAPADELWYAADERELDALTDTADPFVVAAAPMAMRNRCDLRVVGAPVTAPLLDNLVDFQEIWSAWFRDPVVDIRADAERAVDWSNRPAAAAFSGGVDSAFTAYRHARGGVARDRRLTTALMIQGVDIPRVHVVGFRRAAARSRAMVESIGLDLVTVETNAWELFTQPYPIAAGIASAFHLLGTRYGRGLLPGTVSYQHLQFPLGSTPVADPLLGSGTVEIVHDGAAYERFDKVAALLEWPEALEHLRVCLQDPHRDRNCGTCPKCMITQLAFRVLDVVPGCFEPFPSDAEFAAWAGSLPSLPLYEQEAQTILDRATARGVRAPWIRPLARRVQVIRTKRAIRTVAPVWSDRVAGVHRIFVREWRQRRS